ncbi:MAG: DegQ family serine endoprotease [Burkholderiales bacterium]|nr:DegQ family serine endoprotease [Burkholderiales bacterium]
MGQTLRVLALPIAALAFAAQAAPPLAALRDGVPTLAPMLAQVTPAVVNIAVIQRRPEMQNPLLRDPFFRRFFGLPDAQRPQMSAGSGVIMDAAQGYVLTNHHVIKDASEVVVTLKDNRRFQARVVGSDAGTDIALLKIEAEGLVAAQPADSDALQVGDFVVAIGNPFGIGQTVTSGIVSALGRAGLSSGAYEEFIQTDAPINPGNSGGALVNLNGELVGINTAIIGPAGGNVGIGFAVPVNMAQAVMRQLIRFGEVRRGRLGISMQDLAPDLARSLGIAPGEGAVIAEVQPDSPAARAGLRAGDVVTAVNGRPVRTASGLRARLGVLPVGETVELVVRRDGATRIVRARIGEIEARHARQGRRLAELEGATLAAVRNGAQGDRSGVLVVAVEAGTPAFEAGLRPGDLIVGVNRRRVESVDALAQRLRGGGQAALNVLRGDFLLTIVIG